MSDHDKKIVNTEEENRAVNPGDSQTPDDSISQEPAHTVNTETSDKPKADSGNTPDEPRTLKAGNKKGEIAED